MCDDDDYQPEYDYYDMDAHLVGIDANDAARGDIFPTKEAAAKFIADTKKVVPLLPNTSTSRMPVSMSLASSRSTSKEPIMNEIELTMYLVGVDEDDAQTRFPFSDYKDAEDYCQAEFGGDANIYSVTARLDFATMEKEG